MAINNPITTLAALRDVDLTGVADGDIIYYDSAASKWKPMLITSTQARKVLAYLLAQANILHIPTNSGWTATLTGSGGTIQDVFRNAVYTGITANSSAILTATLRGFSKPLVEYNWINWDAKLNLIFQYARFETESQAVARIQLKQVGTQGALAAKGIGLRADNLALIGESYGTELGEVDLGFTVTSAASDLIVIIHDPSVPKIEWYVNGSLKGTQTTAAKIPSGNATSQSYIAHSIINGATGGTNTYSICFHPRLWQAL